MWLDDVELWLDEAPWLEQDVRFTLDPLLHHVNASRCICDSPCIIQEAWCNVSRTI
jgi:hypothetical protein